MVRAGNRVPVPEAPRDAAPRKVGDVVDGRYRVLQVHSDGAMGLVYRVRHMQWGTDLAMKCPRPELFASAADRDRFVEEAETWVSLGLHPHVCGCHYVRLVDGLPSVFAEYVDGGSLQDAIRSRRLYAGGPEQALERILDIAVQFARGLDHAHTRGLVHQDVKPGNVLLDRDGTAKVTDFGLARARGGSARAEAGAGPQASILVTTGGLTPAYASPEQSALRPLGRRTDVYSFAVSVLEMFTGGVSWAAGPIAGLALRSHLVNGPEDEGLPRIPLEAVEVLAACLSPDPDDRPSTMAEVAAQFAAVYEELVGRPYSRPAAVAADLRADELNNRALSLLDLGRVDEAAASFDAALAADPRHLRAVYNAGLLQWQLGALTDEGFVDRIDRARRDAGDPAEGRQLLARAHLARGQLPDARELLDGVTSADEPDAAAALAAVGSGTVVHARCTARREVPWAARPSRRVLDKDGKEYRRFESLPVALTDDGTRLLVGGADGVLQLWDVIEGRCLKTLKGHRRKVESVALTPDGRYALSRCAGELVRFWDLSKMLLGGLLKGAALHHGTPKPHARYEDDPSDSATAKAVALTPDGRTAAAVDAEGTLRVWDTASRRLRRAFPGHRRHAEVDLTADGSRVLAIGDTDDKRPGAHHRDYPALLWDVTGGARLRELRGHESFTTSLFMSPDGRRAVTGTSERLRLWDLSDGRCLRTFTGARWPHALALSPDGRQLAAADAYHGSLRVWDTDTGRCVRTFHRHEGHATAVHFTADGRGLISTGDDRTVRHWSLPAGYTCTPQLSRPRRHDELHRLGSRVEQLLADAERARSAGFSAAALDALRQARETPGYERAPQVMAAWHRLARHTRRTGLRTAWTARTLQGHSAYVGGIDVSPDGRIAVSVSHDRTMRLWDVTTGTCTRVFEGHTAPVYGVSLSPDGELALSSGRDATARLWHLGSGTCEHVFRTQPGVSETAAVCFTADGRHAVTGGAGNVQIWDVHSGDKVREWKTPTRRTSALALSPDGHTLATAGDGGTHLWNLADGTQLGAFVDPRSDVLSLESAHSVSFSADGRRLWTGGGVHLSDDTIRLWDIATGQVLKELQRQGGCRFVHPTPDGAFAVSGGFTGHPHIWDLTTGHHLRTLGDRTDRTGVTALAMPLDGRLVVAGAGEGELRVWELDWELSAEA
ncbi:WD40 repeat domain-containing serine/threonine protein kinase [Streptomyces sp. NPDC050418]|uniref:WD40 repeat domain-containing serine/threonine protein kinase n=1 Tax=Streptomyces sp. NPDC050418 TaxID=3365612 RepID=UPI0037A4E14B